MDGEIWSVAHQEQRFLMTQDFCWCGFQSRVIPMKVKYV
jgi:hypothetical protein